MEAQQPAHEQHTDSDQHNELEDRSKPLFTCQIRDDLLVPAEAICDACLEALDNLASDAFYAADVASQQFASGKMRPIGRRLDGLRLRLEIWMVDVGLDTAGATSVPWNGYDYFEPAVGRKVRTISQSCKTVASCLREMYEDFQFMASDWDTAGRGRVSSVTRNGELVNATLDDVESTIHSLTGLITPILMARALKTVTGRYSEVQQRVNTIMHGPISSGADYAPRLGNNADFMDRDHLSYPSGGPSFNIEPATQEADPSKSSGSQKAPATSPPSQSHSSTIRSHKHHGDPQNLRIQHESGQGTGEMIEINREDQREIREPERPDPMIMTATAAGVALGGAATFTVDHLSSHGNEDQGGTNPGRNSKDSGYGGSFDDDEGCCGDFCEGEGCCGDCCYGCSEGEDEGCCDGCCDCDCGWWLCGR